MSEEEQEDQGILDKLNSQFTDFVGSVFGNAGSISWPFLFPWCQLKTDGLAFL